VTANQSAAFAALGDSTRRAVFERLARRPLSVQKLADGLAVTRSAVSQHLKVLRAAGLVALAEEAGTRRIYRVDTRGVEAMRSYLDKCWNQALLAFKAAAEEEKR